MSVKPDITLTQNDVELVVSQTEKQLDGCLHDGSIIAESLTVTKDGTEVVLKCEVNYGGTRTSRTFRVTFDSEYYFRSVVAAASGNFVLFSAVGLVCASVWQISSLCFQA